MSRWIGRLSWLVGIIIVVKIVNASHAYHDRTGGLDYATLLMGVLGGLALFLFGMDRMGTALKHVAGDRMKLVLARFTENRIVGLFTGAFVTAVIQSSSVTTVMLVGFVGAGLMTLPQAIGVILGADIGTTVTAQIVAFKVTHYAGLLIAVGFGMLFLAKDDDTQQRGRMIMGLGLIFFGMGQMSTVMAPLKSHQGFIDLLGRMGSNPWLGVLTAAVFTALVQASAATMGVIIVLASQGVLTLEAGIALALGANIGTCATAGLACIGKPRSAQRVALAHVLFKVLGVLIAVPLIPQLTHVVRLISPMADPTLPDPVRWAAEVPRQVANAHTIFNCTIAFAFLPFSDLFAKLIERILPDKPEPEVEVAAKPRYLDPAVIDTPVLALGLVRREMSRIGDRLERMLADVPTAVFDGDLHVAESLRTVDDEVDALYTSITGYLSEVGQGLVSDETADEILLAITAANEFESIGDIIENNLTHLAAQRASLQTELDEEVVGQLREFHELVSRAVRSAIAAFVTDNREAATIVNGMKDDIARRDAETRARQSQWLRGGASPERLAAYTVEMDILENLKRIYYHAKRVAKLVLREADAAAWVTAEAA